MRLSDEDVARVADAVVERLRELGVVPMQNIVSIAKGERRRRSKAKETPEERRARVEEEKAAVRDLIAARLKRSK